MYLAHYALAEKPFEPTPDPRFLWLGESHRQALETMKYAVLENQGFLALTGDVGTGKTTLINALLSGLGSDTLVASMPDPRLEVAEFLQAVAQAFSYDGGDLSSRLAFLSWFSALLEKARARTLKVLLIIDEAQTLSLELLEEIRLLSNIERPEAKLFNVFFVGQSEFDDILHNQQCKALTQRITINYKLRPLTFDETREYVRHRLRLAGAKGEIFASASIKEVHAFSSGYPRLINVICDRALLTGYLRKMKTISRAVVKNCRRELTLPGELRGNLRELEGLAQKRQPFAPTWRLAAYGVLLVAVGAVLGYMLPVLGSRSGLWTDVKNDTSGVKTRIERVPRAPNSQVGARSGHATTVEAPVVSRPSAEGGAPTPPPKGLTSVLPFPDPRQGKTTEGAEVPDPFGKSKVVIAFEFDTVTFSDAALAKLDEVARYMLQKPELVIAIRGYTDSYGNANYNRTVSEFRATAVKTYLAGKGIGLQRMRTAGLGGTNPVMPNTTAEGRRANRRVEIEPIGDGL
jgi:general secretion pathway protein A